MVAKNSKNSIKNNRMDTEINSINNNKYNKNKKKPTNSKRRLRALSLTMFLE